MTENDESWGEGEFDRNNLGALCVCRHEWRDHEKFVPHGAIDRPGNGRCCVHKCECREFNASGMVRPPNALTPAAAEAIFGEGAGAAAAPRIDVMHAAVQAIEAIQRMADALDRLAPKPRKRKRRRTTKR